MEKANGLSKILYALIACLILAFMTTGCMTTGPKYSGWLDHDYSKLQPDPEYEGAMIWLAPDNVIKNYDKMMFDDVAIHVDPNIADDREKIDPEVINDFTSYFKEALIKEFSKDYEVVDKPGKGVVRIRTALTAVQLTKKDLKAYQYIPVALVLTTASEVAGIRNKLAVFNMEGIAQDSLTGEVLAMVVQRHAHETSIQTAEKMTAQEAYPTLDYWVQKAKKKFDRAHGK
ncbi:MAG: DUF3313 domain-containing protein [Desulfobacterales bacterium]|nr:DUF3313 domain-containing protein [Desulfobacterales bacterium]